MRRITQENIVAVLLLGVFVGVIWLCQDFGPRARMIPLPLAIGGIVLTLVQLLWQNLRSTDELQIELISVAAPGAADQEPERAAGETQPAVRPFGELRAYGLVALLIALVLSIGIVPAVFVYTAGYFLLTRQYSAPAALLYTSIFTVGVYMLFFVALQIQPYHGLLAPLFERYR